MNIPDVAPRYGSEGVEVFCRHDKHTTSLIGLARTPTLAKLLAQALSLRAAVVSDELILSLPPQPAEKEEG